MKTLIEEWIEWNEKRLDARDFCSIFGNTFRKEIIEFIAKRIKSEAKIKQRVNRMCENNCGVSLIGQQRYFCSRICATEGKRKRVAEAKT